MYYRLAVVMGLSLLFYQGTPTPNSSELLNGVVMVGSFQQQISLQSARAFRNRRLKIKVTRLSE
jgi:hypothetical protein